MWIENEFDRARLIPIGVDAWRFDFGPKPDFSLIIIWNKEGKVGQIKKVSPGLWHGDELFGDKEPNPAFQPDGSFHPGHKDSISPCATGFASAVCGLTVHCVASRSGE